MGRIPYKIGEDEYVLFSTVVDDVVAYQMNREQLYEVMLEDAIESAKHQLDRYFEYDMPRRDSIPPEEGIKDMAESYWMNRRPMADTEADKPITKKMIKQFMDFETRFKEQE
jgi:hypothetical protein